MITNPVSLGQPQSNNTPSNQAGANPLGDVGSNSNALNPPAKLSLGGNASGIPIAGDSSFHPYGTPSTGPATTGASLTTNSTHDIVTQAASHSTVSTWSKLAQQSGPSQPIESTKTLDSFQQFKKQAREQLDKKKLLEMQAQRQREREQQEREQAERERLTQDQEGEMALNSLARAEQSPVLSPVSDSQSPASAVGTSGGSSMLKLREQERRKREALANQNLDLSRQSEIMSKFESDRV